MSEENRFCDLFRQSIDEYKANHPDRHMSQIYLAKRLGVTKSTITNWKKGTTQPRNRENVLNLSSALKLKRGMLEKMLLSLNFAPLQDTEAQHYYPEDASTHAQLPAPIKISSAIQERCPGFCVERTNLLEEFRQLCFAPPTPINLVIHGIGGAGKTVLVASFLTQSESQLLKTFRDGVVWIDLENPLIDPLLQIGDQLGLPPQAAPDDGLRRTIVQQSRTRRLLWVIDGCETTGDATPWLDMVRAAQGKFIVTLRESPEPAWLSQWGAKLLKVGDLQEDEGLKLTENILQTPLPTSEIPGWLEMAHQVSHHPLSLRILAGCAYFDPTPQRWENLAQDLRRQGTLAIQLVDTQPDGDKSGSAHRCLQISYERLSQRSPAAARCFRLLGILNCVEVEPELAKQLLDSAENSGRLLAILAQAGLVEVSRGSNSYHMHRLLHLCAQTLLRQNPAEYGMISDRYVTALRRHLPSIPVDINRAARDPFLGEYLHAIDVAYQIGRMGDLLDILNRTYLILLGINHSEQVKQTIEAILPTFTQMKQLNGEPLAWLCKAYGDTLLSRLEPKQALAQYKQVVEQSENPLLLFTTHLQRALCAHVLGLSMDVLQEISSARQLFEALPDEQKAVCRQEYQLTLQQVEWVEAGLVINQDAGSMSLQERILNAHDLLETGSFAEGCSVLEALDKELSFIPLIAFRGDVLQMLAYGYLQQKESARAYETLDRLEKLLGEAIDSPDLRILWAQLWQHRGYYELQLSHLSLAQESLSKSLEIWKTIPNSTGTQHNIQAFLSDIAEALAE